MGSLTFWNLDQLKSKHNLDIFVETGLGWGDGLQYAARSNFQELYSIELIKEVIDTYLPKYPVDSRIKIINSSSSQGLKYLLPLIPKDKNICFWVDAHFPASDVFGIPFDSCADESLRLPLWEELNLIKELRPNNKDVILMDDAMIFSETKVFPDNHLKEAFAIKPREHINYLDKIINLFEETHDSLLTVKDSGYISFTPKI